MKKIILLLFSSVYSLFLLAQINNDTTSINRQLQDVTVKGYKTTIQEVKELQAVQQLYINSGKKNISINIADLPANLSEKTGRQIFAKIPGAFVYDMDGSGNQVNIATRGLDPHRSWEYNVRQNGVLTNSDMYGYPASHYSPPMEAIQRVELVHGSAALQYGAQFGGMINYIVKEADTTRKIGFENISSIGSFGLMSSYNAIGGKVGKLTYYAYYQKRVSDGYRDYAQSKAQSQYLRLNYAFSPRLNLRAELGRSQYVYRIPGPLTDSMFKQNPRQATRQRNYYEPDIYVPSLTFDWIISKNSKIQWVTSAVLGQRNSVQFVGLANVVDKIDATTLQYKPRQVDRDHFNSYTSELRWQLDYNIGRLNNTLVSGLRYMNNDLHRQQQGKGTTGTDYDLSLTVPNYGRDVHLKTQNVAVFVENLFKITSKLDVTAGVRYENGVSKMRGVLSYLPNEKVPQDIQRNYPLWGASATYRFNQNHKIYAAWSQAYRPVVFSDILPPTVLDSTDRNLKDAFGSVTEIGLKGQFSFLKYELTAFSMLYQNRIGTLYISNSNRGNFILKTNIGDSRTNGLELFTEAKLFENDYSKIAIFTSTALFDAQYLNGSIRNGNDNIDIRGKRLETVPQVTSRNGLQVSYKGFGAILQYSYVSKSYSDAFNLETPTANGASGVVPAYDIWDLNCSYRFNRRYVLRFGVNNMFNRQYFTKRPIIYPGQGVWSSDGRGIVVSLGVKL